MKDYRDPEKITEGMKSGLARMYADEDIRAYLEHTTNVYNHNVLASMRLGLADKAKDYTAKFDTLKKLLENGRAMYAQAERLKRTPLAELIKEQDAADKK